MARDVLAEYLKISTWVWGHIYAQEIQGDVQKHLEIAHKGLKLEQALLVKTTRCQQPAGNKLPDLLPPISEQMQEMTTFWEKNQGSKLFNHLLVVSKSIQALVWVAMAPY